MVLSVDASARPNTQRGHEHTHNVVEVFSDGIQIGGLTSSEEDAGHDQQTKGVSAPPTDPQREGFERASRCHGSQCTQMVGTGEDVHDAEQ